MRLPASTMTLSPERRSKFRVSPRRRSAIELELGAFLLVQMEDVLLEEDVEDFLVVVAERAQQLRHRQLAPTVDAREQRVLRVEFEVEPRAAIGNDARGVQQLARAVRLAAVVIEEHARRTMQLRDDHALGAVDDEGAGVGHERQFAHVDFLFLDVFDRLVAGRRFLVVNDQAHEHAQRRAVTHATRTALALVERGLAEAVAHILQRRVAGIADDRKHRFQRGVQAMLLALAARPAFLQELAVRIGLDRQQRRYAEHDRALAEILADALLLGEGIGGCRHGRVPPA